MARLEELSNCRSIATHLSSLLKIGSMLRKRPPAGSEVYQLPFFERCFFSLSAATLAPSDLTSCLFPSFTIATTFSAFS